MPSICSDEMDDQDTSSSLPCRDSSCDGRHMRFGVLGVGFCLGLVGEGVESLSLSVADMSEESFACAIESQSSQSMRASRL